MTDYIYALLCPQGEIRYIGKTNRPERRLLQHVSAARTCVARHHCAQWIRSLLRKGESPTLEVIYEVPAGDDWKAHEVHQIKTFRELGFSLTNIGEGGEGTFDMRPEAVKARVAKARITKATPEYKERTQLSWRRPWQDPKIRQARLAAMAEARLRPGHHEKMVSAGIEVGSRPEVKEKRSRAIKASFATGLREITIRHPEIVAKKEAGVAARWAKPGEKEKLSAAMRDPERQAVMQAAAHSPEAKAKRAAKVAVIQATAEFLENQAVKARAQWQNPEYLAKRKEALEARHAATHTPEHLALIRDRRNGAKRAKRAVEKAAKLAATTTAPYTEAS